MPFRAPHHPTSSRTPVAALAALALSALLAVLTACGGGSIEDDYEDDYDDGSYVEPGAFWQLADDAPFEVRLTPTQPKAGEPTIIDVEVGPGDWHEGPYPVDSLSYRLADSPYSLAEWIPMESQGHDDWTALYRAEATFPAGKVYVQFLLEAKTLEGPLELDDYFVTVE